MTRARDAQEPNVDKVLSQRHNLRSASVEFKLSIICRLGALKQSGPRGGWRIPIRRGVRAVSVHEVSRRYASFPRRASR
ncbi:MAG: hypothetical protein WAT25_04025, partial [Paracoccaceae bacterium]